MINKVKGKYFDHLPSSRKTKAFDVVFLLIRFSIGHAIYEKPKKRELFN